MDSINSFKGYGKVDELQQQEFRRKTRKRLIIIIISAIVLFAVVIGAVAGTLLHKRNNSSSSNQVPPSTLTPAASLTGVCSVTQYPSSCVSSIAALQTANSSDPQVLFKLSLQAAINEVSTFADYFKKLIDSSNDTRLNEALKVCDIVFDDALDRFNDSVSSMEDANGGKFLSDLKVDDLRTWLSTAITDQETCLDALEELNSTIIDQVKVVMQNSTEFASNSLAIVTRILSLLSNFGTPANRKLLSSESVYPSWMRSKDRSLLQDTNLTPNVTVATDGSGDFRTIVEAVAQIPKKSNTRYIIYVKEGVYVENVIFDKSKWNVMMYGDGKDKTIVSGSLNFVDLTPTFKTATVAAVGKGFMAKDMKFINTAGPEKHQAVAFRSGSDMSVFYRCSFDAYQDTLYAHSNRQFYRECDITGTIDFIFGNAAVVFQNCNIKPRQPMPSQFVTITAQGKKDPNQNTGISIQKCMIIETLGSNYTARTYLGRPWKPYSTTVIMQSSIGSFLHPLGWIEWIQNVIPPSTIFYAEYSNTGLGSDVTGRVTWAGYKPALTKDEAAKYTVDSFIQGKEWLPTTAVEFDNTL